MPAAPQMRDPPASSSLLSSLNAVAPNSDGSALMPRVQLEQHAQLSHEAIVSQRQVADIAQMFDATFNADSERSAGSNAVQSVNLPEHPAVNASRSAPSPAFTSNVVATPAADRASTSSITQQRTNYAAAAYTSTPHTSDPSSESFSATKLMMGPPLLTMEAVVAALDPTRSKLQFKLKTNNVSKTLCILLDYKDVGMVLAKQQIDLHNQLLKAINSGTVSRVDKEKLFEEDAEFAQENWFKNPLKNAPPLEGTAVPCRTRVQFLALVDLLRDDPTRNEEDDAADCAPSVIYRKLTAWIWRVYVHLKRQSAAAMDDDDDDGIMKKGRTGNMEIVTIACNCVINRVDLVIQMKAQFQTKGRPEPTIEEQTTGLFKLVCHCDDNSSFSFVANIQTLEKSCNSFM